MWLTTGCIVAIIGWKMTPGLTTSAILVASAMCLPALAQDHAPTLEQCVADYQLWSGQRFAGEKGEYKGSATVIEEEQKEMDLCGGAYADKDAPIEKEPAFAVLSIRLMSDLYNRRVDFLIRHQLAQAYFKERSESEAVWRRKHPESPEIALTYHDAGFARNYFSAKQLNKRFYAEDEAGGR
jgi:hypothetical protein